MDNSNPRLHQAIKILLTYLLKEHTSGNQNKDTEPSDEHSKKPSADAAKIKELDVT